MRYPDAAALAAEAYTASGCRSHPEFVALFYGAIGLRTFRRWLAGDGPLDGLAKLVLREFVAGWRPSVGA